MKFAKYISTTITVVLLLLFYSTYGQTSCYETRKDHLGVTGALGLTELGTAACELVNALPEPFRPQFKIYSTSYYLHTTVTTPGFPPMLESFVTEVGALSPYYLIIAKESASDGVFKKFKVVLKLPETGQLSCMTANDRIFIANQLEEIANSAFIEKSKMAIQYPYAEKAAVDKLKRYIIKAIDCCISGNKMPGGTCSFCPDLEKAAQLKRLFEDTLGAIKIPIIVNNAISPSSAAYPLTVTVEEASFKFRASDPDGMMASVISKVLLSDYFEGIYQGKIKGYMTSNSGVCFPNTNEIFEGVKASFKEIIGIPSDNPGGIARSSAIEYAIWGHVWEDPNDDDAQDYLYIAGHTPDWMTLQEANAPNIKEKLEKSYLYNYESGAYTSKFEQSATSLAFNTVASCFPEILATEIEPHVPDYAPKDIQIFCDNQQLGSKWYLSPAMQPVLVPGESIPDFSSPSGASSYGFDPRCLTFFTTQTERWHGCFHPKFENDQKTYESFTGYYSVVTRGVWKYVALPLGHVQQSQYLVLLNSTNYANGERELTYKIYTPPQNRPIDPYAKGALVSNLDNPAGLLSPPLPPLPVNPPIVQIYPWATSTLEDLRIGLKDAVYYPSYGGLILKVPHAAAYGGYDYFMVNRSEVGNINSAAVWYQFNCGTGKWTKLDQTPFAQSDPRGDFWLGVYANLEVIHNSLDILGTIPVFGEVFDLINGVIYFTIEGDRLNAALSCTSIIPIVGDALGKGGKLLREGVGSVSAQLARIYPTGTTGELLEAAAKLADDGKTAIEAIVLGVPCPFGNKGMASGVTCTISLATAKIKQKAKSIYNDVSSPDFAAFMQDVQSKARPNPPLAVNTDFAEAVAKATKGEGPDLFHAWNLAKKAEIDLNLEQLIKLGGDLERNPTLAKAMYEQKDLVKYWKELEVVGIGQKKRTAVELLQRMDIDFKDTELFGILGSTNAEGKARYLDIIYYYAGKCSSCGNSGYGILPGIDEYLELVSDFSKKHNNAEGFQVPFFNNQVYSQEGFYHLMKHANTFPNGSIKKMDMTFEDELGNSIPCVGGPNAVSCFDLEVDPELANGIRFFEYKCLIPGSIPNLTYNQFRTYLQNVNSLDEFKYIFNNLKCSKVEAKNKMKNYIKNKADDLFKDVTDGGIGKDKCIQLFGDDIDTAQKLKAILDAAPPSPGTFTTEQERILRFIDSF